MDIRLAGLQLAFFMMRTTDEEAEEELIFLHYCVDIDIDETTTTIIGGIPDILDHFITNHKIIRQYLLYELYKQNINRKYD